MSSTAEVNFGPLAASGKETLRLAMQRLWLTGRILPAGAHLTIQHIFRSEEEKPLEVIYSFPLPRDAALRAFRITGDGFEVHSELIETEAAVEAYERGIREGSLAALARQYGDGVVNLTVGNVRPNETITVYLELLAGVELRDDGFRFRFPFTLAPAYHAGMKAARVSEDEGEIELPPDQFGDMLLPRFRKDADALHEVGFDISVLHQLPISEIGSPSHSIRVKQDGASPAHVALARERDVPNRDLVLDVRFKETASQVLSGAAGKHAGARSSPDSGSAAAIPGWNGAQKLHQAASKRKSPRTEHFHDSTASTRRASGLTSTLPCSGCRPMYQVSALRAGIYQGPHPLAGRRRQGGQLPITGQGGAPSVHQFPGVIGPAGEEELRQLPPARPPGARSPGRPGQAGTWYRATSRRVRAGARALACSAGVSSEPPVMTHRDGVGPPGRGRAHLPDLWYGQVRAGKGHRHPVGLIQDTSGPKRSTSSSPPARFTRVGKRLGADAAARLFTHSWPGNVRELKNAMERVAVLVRGDVVRADDLNFIAAGKPRNSLRSTGPTKISPRRLRALRRC